jgi:ketosteroid isomerase-like protein
VDAAEVHRWVADYERVWRTPGTDALTDIFTDDVTYLTSPWAEPITGLADIASFWEAGRDGADEGFAMTSEVLAVDPDRSTAVVRVSVDYDAGSRWRDLWVIRFAGDGRCTAFEEWPFAPEQSDGQESPTGVS